MLLTSTSRTQMLDIEPLVATWRDEAQLYRRRGREDLALFLESLIEEVVCLFEHYDDASMTLAQASAEGGYSPSHLGRLVRDGDVPNAGRPNAPRIARRHLPSKPVPPLPSSPDLSRTQIVRSATGEV